MLLSSLFFVMMLSIYFFLTSLSFFFFNDTATTEIYTLSLHDALPIYRRNRYTIQSDFARALYFLDGKQIQSRSEEHTSELQSLRHLVCRLLLEKKKKKQKYK